MRMFTLSRAVEITCEMFDTYVEPFGLAGMYGEIPRVSFTVHRYGTRDKDWVAALKVKNTLTISVFKATVYIADVFHLCRLSKMYLVTEDMFAIVVLYHMLHPIFQQQHMNVFNAGTDALDGYESMIAEAGKSTHKFIIRNYPFHSELEYLTLDMLKRWCMMYCNHYWGTTSCAEIHRTFERYMLEHYRLPYRVSRFRKASNAMCNEEGFVLLERREESANTNYIDGNH